MSGAGEREGRMKGRARETEGGKEGDEKGGEEGSGVIASPNPHMEIISKQDVDLNKAM